MDAAEQESLEALRIWWNRWGNTISFLVIAAAVVYGGYTYYNWSVNEKKASASEAYTMLIRNAQAQEDDAFLASADKIIHQYPNLPYADLTSFLLADKLAKDEDWLAAAQTLERVTKESKNSALSDIARIRLARLHFSQKSFESALVALKDIKTDSFKPLALELKGDLYRAQKNVDEAIKAYQAALASDPIARELRESFIMMKLGDLGVDPALLDIPLD
ncbi:MAG: hypothetical protein CMF48_06475 [Legionellales bacterium]|nr:hypothetical protein [Legionellales bacterium]|tara:strand:- start:131 stop:787 length:657 start_codon:yes stop_codon:yes gene_type:complete